MNVSKKIGNKWILQDINLEIGEKQFTVIFGPTGAGKTELLYIITGLMKPDKGRVFYGDTDVTYLPAYKRNVAFVFEEYALFPHLSVYDNITIGLKVRKYDKNEIKERVQEIAKLLKIEHVLDRKSIITLSGGERNRVALARALVRKEADLFIFDEPLSRVDYKIREALRTEFRQIRDKIGKTCIYSTPYFEDAMTLGDKVAVLINGKIRQYGDPAEIYEHPKDIYVASVFGNPPMNLVTGEVKRNNGQVLFECGELSLDITPYKDKIKGMQKITIGIRPEKITLGEGGDVKVDVKLVAVDVVGTETIAYFKVGQVLLKSYCPFILREKPDTIYFNYEDIYLFDEKGNLLEGE
jgi:multiple sugar transport system ATP-binding protein